VTITAATTGAATTSAPHESPQPRGRLDDGAAAARTEELYARYARTVSGLCRALLRDRTEAEDAAQQAFLSAHRALLNGAEPREPAAWLATIARNECWARIRTRMREPLPTDELDTVSTAHDPLEEAIRRADLALLWSAVAALPLPQRNALLLREFGGLSYEELAEALDVSGSAVESLLFRARQRLRVQLRTVYASLAGASWLDTLARIFAGGGAPVAAKVAALGVGAAAVGSSAVVVPHVFDNHTHLKPPVHATRTHAHPVAPVLAERAIQTPSAPRVAQPAVVHTVAALPNRAVAHEVDQAEHGSRGGSEHHGGQTTESEPEHSGRGGGGEAAEPARESAADESGRDGDESESGHDGSGSGSGSGSGGGGDHGQTAMVTVTDATAVAPAPVDEHGGGDSGGRDGGSHGSDGDSGELP
jgi:RNA polymerase sigma-70 factor (ECF subfamily)